MEEPSPLLSWHRIPLPRTLVAVNADIVPPYWRGSKPWHDKRQVASARNHRMGTIGIALLRSIGMRVDVGNNHQPAFLTDIP
jgi:hypothetical protein